MKLAIFSDIHNEFEVWNPPKLDADVVILAGDIHSKHHGVQWAIESFDIPVIYVPGNHEYYGANIDSLNKKLKQKARNSNVHVLLNESIVIDGVNFIGSTLWADFNLLGRDRRKECMFHAAVKMNDYQRIRVNDNGKYRKLKASDTASFCKLSLDFIKAAIAESKCSKNVVITHHAPSGRSTPEQFKDDILSAAFASNLDNFIANSAIDLWVHGHTHHNVDYRIGNTRIVSNQRGYALREENRDFIERYIIEV